MFKAIKKFWISRGSALNAGLNPASYGDGPAVDGYHWEFVFEDDGSHVIDGGKYVVELVADTPPPSGTVFTATYLSQGMI